MGAAAAAFAPRCGRPLTGASHTMRHSLRLSLRVAPFLAAVVPFAGTAAQQPAAAAASGHTTQPSDESAAVLAIVPGLFDAMRADDSTRARASFHPAAQLATALMTAGQPEVRIDSVDKFVRAVGTPHTDVWDERTRNEVVHVDGPLAVVWTEYSFYAGSKFSHCGVDAFQLARTPAGWRIIALADTRQLTGCPRPGGAAVAGLVREPRRPR